MQIVRQRDGAMEAEGGRTEEDNGILRRKCTARGGVRLEGRRLKKIEIVVGGEVASHQEQ